jgi:hypothetical protein
MESENQMTAIAATNDAMTGQRRRDNWMLRTTRKSMAATTTANTNQKNSLLDARRPPAK